MTKLRCLLTMGMGVGKIIEIKFIQYSISLTVLAMHNLGLVFGRPYCPPYWYNARDMNNIS